jgi:hypothetical protein
VSPVGGVIGAAGARRWRKPGVAGLQGTQHPGQRGHVQRLGQEGHQPSLARAGRQAGVVFARHQRHGHRGLCLAQLARPVQADGAAGQAVVDQHQVDAAGPGGQQGLGLGRAAAAQHLHAGQRLLQRQRQAFAEQRVVVDQQQVQGGRGGGDDARTGRLIRRACADCAAHLGMGGHQRRRQQGVHRVGRQRFAMPAPVLPQRCGGPVAQAGQQPCPCGRLKDQTGLAGQPQLAVTGPQQLQRRLGLTFQRQQPGMQQAAFEWLAHGRHVAPGLSRCNPRLRQITRSQQAAEQTGPQRRCHMAVHATCCDGLREPCITCRSGGMAAQQMIEQGQVALQHEQQVAIALRNTPRQRLGMGGLGVGLPPEQCQCNASCDAQDRPVVGPVTGLQQRQGRVGGNQCGMGLTQLAGGVCQRMANRHRVLGAWQGVQQCLAALELGMPLLGRQLWQAQGEHAQAQQVVACGARGRVRREPRRQCQHPAHGLVVLAHEQHRRPGVGQDGMAHRRPRWHGQHPVHRRTDVRQHQADAIECEVVADLAALARQTVARQQAAHRFGMALAQGVEHAPGAQTGQGMGANGFQQAEAGDAGLHLGHHQTVVCELPQAVEGGSVVQAEGRRQLQCQLHVDITLAHAQRCQQGLCRLGQQRHAPGQRRSQRGMALRPGAAGEQLQPPIQPRQHALQAQGRHPCRRQLDGQRQAIEPAAQGSGRRQFGIGQQEVGRQ